MKEKIEKEALEKYSTPHGKANPETHAFIAGVTSDISKDYWEKELEVKEMKEVIEKLQDDFIMRTKERNQLQYEIDKLKNITHE